MYLFAGAKAFPSEGIDGEDGQNFITKADDKEFREVVNQPSDDPPSSSEIKSSEELRAIDEPEKSNHQSEEKKELWTTIPAAYPNRPLSYIPLPPPPQMLLPAFMSRPTMYYAPPPPPTFTPPQSSKEINSSEDDTTRAQVLDEPEKSNEQAEEKSLDMSSSTKLADQLAETLLRMFESMQKNPERPICGCSFSSSCGHSPYSTHIASRPYPLVSAYGPARWPVPAPMPISAPMPVSMYRMPLPYPYMSSSYSAPPPPPHMAPPACMQRPMIQPPVYYAPASPPFAPPTPKVI